MNHHTHYNYSGGSGISGKHRARMNRDREFLSIYRRTLDLMLEHGVPDARRAAIDFTVLHSHPHYHVSYDRAYLVVSHILKHNSNPVKPSLQANMWQEIADKVKHLIENKGVSIPHAVQFVLEHCLASRFFITPQYAYTHIRHINPIVKPSNHHDHLH